MSYLARRRRNDPLLLVGIAVSLLLHGGMAAAILIDRDARVQPVAVPREFVVAKMVRLGRKRPKNFLPVIPPRVTAQAPRRRIGLTDNENAAPSKRDERRDRDAAEAKALRRASNLAEVFAAAQEERDPEGDPRGSPLGTATEATAGDAYATACAEAVQRYWTVPPEVLLPEPVLARLSAEVRVIIDAQGKVYQAAVKSPSHNRYFDASLKDALGRLDRLPPPPADLVQGHPRVGVILVFEGKDLKR